MASKLEWTFRDGVKHGHDGAKAYPHKIKESTSSNGLTKYLTILWTDGVITCDCKGWAIRKKDSNGNPKPRICRHCKEATACNHTDMVAVNDFVPATSTPTRRTQLNLPVRAMRTVCINRQQTNDT